MYIKRFVKHYYIMLIPALLWLFFFSIVPSDRIARRATVVLIPGSVMCQIRLNLPAPSAAAAS